MNEPSVVRLIPQDTHDLRRRVLRDSDSAAHVEWPGDHLASTVHLGIIVDGSVVATSTWLWAPSPDASGADTAGLQLRGMATEPSARGLGYGQSILVSGIDHARTLAAGHVWANARVTALGFYTSHGFEVTSEEFTTADTGLAHRRIFLAPDFPTAPDRAH